MDEETIWRLTKMTDLCMTRCIPSQQALGSLVNARKFTAVLALERFAGVRDVAYEVYAVLTKAGHLCPVVEPTALDGMRMTWSEEGRILEIILTPDCPVMYNAGKGFTVQTPDLDLRTLLQALSCYLGAGS